MNIKFLNPFIEAGVEVIHKETGISFQRGDLRLEKTPYMSDDVTVIISLVGMVSGNVFYSTNLKSGMTLVSKMIGEPITDFDNLAQSGIAELGNVITGRASVKLAEAGYESTISPPALLLGKGAVLSTLDYFRLVVPLSGDEVSLTIHLALREDTSHNVATPSLAIPEKPNILEIK
jgi:chemotaxis protein CheX